MIKCALIYKTARVQRVGDGASDPKDVYSRVPVAQTFQTVAGTKWTVVVNHFKSKGSCPSSGDVDKGQGCWNNKRSLQSETLLHFIKRLQVESGDSDVMTIGDYNAYAEEDPIRTLSAGGLTNLNEMVPLPKRYSHQFQAHSGLLDYAFATPSLKEQVSRTTIWHINSDEPVLEGQNPKTYFRSSDHDPVIVALNPRQHVPAVAARH
jgi:predicted extracellular nuclease